MGVSGIATTATYLSGQGLAGNSGGKNLRRLRSVTPAIVPSLNKKGGVC
jgi:hypothetical protein